MLLLTLPILIPLIAASACLVVWNRPRTQAGIAVASTVAVAATAARLVHTVTVEGVIATQVGGWDAPFGITLVADRLSAFLICLVSVAGLAVTVASLGVTDSERARHGHYPLVLALLAAVSGAFLAGDLFNLYVWFEALLLSSFVLLTLGGERAQLEGAVKYVTLNLVSSIFFLSSVGLLYGITGTLNFAHLALRIDALSDPTMAIAAGTLLLSAFAVKAAAFPFFFWLPASYHTPPPVVSALFAAVLTKVGVYSLIRVGTLLYDDAWHLMGPVLLVMAGLTMVVGVLGAATQMDMRRILAFHSVSQVGYMLMGLAIAMTALAAARTQGLEDSVTAEASADAAVAGSDFVPVTAGLDLPRGALLALAG
ncbi:MAG: proton-conducting transporter membrane subunit, partial [Planctomycetota bacterium]